MLACQVAHIPEEVSPGLSAPVAKSVQQAMQILDREYLSEAPRGGSTEPVPGPP